jgi:glyoxylase-like metal-dependent hydrolase (beta-lactamase superfamily II)
MFGMPAPEVVAIDQLVEEGDDIVFGKIAGKVIHTPGHSPGGIAIVFEKQSPPSAFVGDVLFMGSIGRTDLMGSDHAKMISTLKNIIMNLPDDMVVYSGHGPQTTIGAEKTHNPFLLEFSR